MFDSADRYFQSSNTSNLIKNRQVNPKAKFDDNLRLDKEVKGFESIIHWT